MNTWAGLLVVLRFVRMHVCGLVDLVACCVVRSRVAWWCVASCVLLLCCSLIRCPRRCCELPLRSKEAHHAWKVKGKGFVVCGCLLAVVRCDRGVVACGGCMPRTVGRDSWGRVPVLRVRVVRFIVGQPRAGWGGLQVVGWLVGRGCWRVS